MAYREYIGHLDTRIRQALVVPESVAAVEWLDAATAQWRGAERYVQVRLVGPARIEFFLYIVSEEFAYDRFGDDLDAPDIASTAEKVAQFFNDADFEESS